MRTSETQIVVTLKQADGNPPTSSGRQKWS
ncbi:hypothetical protein XAP6984_1000090 [Xanthomonas phaseoli pv. phaseoli]|uniref:Transposase n=1 Tax=Xanthomonas campestris pv. phaseoli TaxID=317013 RepID=A0ABY1TL82_XANCH|nr:hypothetical protein XAP6984_1000090 [Xanthomonas phaseoli pv. phaseoli]